MTSRTSPTHPVRLLAASALIVVGLAVGANRVGAETPTETSTPSSTVEASSTPEETETPTSTETPEASATPSASATPVPTEMSLEDLDEHLDQIEAALGNRLSAQTTTRVEAVREAASALFGFGDQIDAGEREIGPETKKEFQQLANVLRTALGELRHSVRGDMAGSAHGGARLLAKGVQQDLRVLKQDIDVVVRAEQRQIKAAVKLAHQDEDTTVTPTADASPTADTSPTAEPTVEDGQALSPSAAALASGDGSKVSEQPRKRGPDAAPSGKSAHGPAGPAAAPGPRADVPRPASPKHEPRHDNAPGDHGSKAARPKEGQGGKKR